MANKILVARGTKARIEAIKSTLATNELVYATDTGELGVKKADGNIQYFMNAADINALVDALDSSKVDKVPGKGLSTNDYTDAEKAKLASVEAQVQNISSELADLQSQVDGLSQSTGGWTLLYSGTTMLPSSGYMYINLSSSISEGDVLAIEVRYGGTTTTYNSKIILTAIGANSSTDTSGTHPRKIGFTEFDGEYFKNVYFTVSRSSSTNDLRAGYYSFLLGRFLPSSNTIEWDTNRNVILYITRVWKVV